MTTLRVLGCSGRSFHFLSSLWATWNWDSFSLALARVHLQPHCSEPAWRWKETSLIWPQWDPLGESSAKANWFRISSQEMQIPFFWPAWGSPSSLLHLPVFSFKTATKIHSLADLLIWDKIILRMHPQFLPVVDSEFYLSQEWICSCFFLDNSSLI